MWVQESELGAALERQELETLLRSAYDLVVDEAAEVEASRRGSADARTGEEGTAKDADAGRRPKASRR